MPFSLRDFGPEVLFAEGEPYDRSTLALNAIGDPISIWSALHTMSEKEWSLMALEVFDGIDPDLLTFETVIEKISETDTCSFIRGCTDVWIDEAGHHTVSVHDGREP